MVARNIRSFLSRKKYQTGFDQPLLHTMYVDKRLAGVQAVQTLSRLNRRAPGKTDTFVLEASSMNAMKSTEAFKPYYEATEIGDMPDPQQLYTLQNELKESPVIHPSDIDQFAEIWSRGSERAQRLANTSNSTRCSTKPWSATKPE